MRTLLGALTTAVLSLALLTGPVPLAQAERDQTAGGRDRSPSCKSEQQSVTVTADARGLRFSTTRIRAGVVSFRASTTNGGSEVTLFRPRRGVSAADVVANVMVGLHTEDDEVRAATARKALRLARFHGLTQVMPGAPATATVELKPGIYYAAEMMFGRPAPTPVKLTVVRDHGRGRHKGCAPRPTATIDLLQGHRISVRGELPASGSVLVRNRSRANQIAVLSPITPGTTEAQVRAYFDGGAQGPWPFPHEGPSVGTDALSPGRELVLSYAVAPGTYILASYMPDPGTGLPEVFLGMQRVVILG